MSHRDAFFWLSTERKPRRLKAFVSDYNGTFIADAWHCWKSVRMVCQDYGVPPPSFEQYRRIDGLARSFGNIYVLLGIEERTTVVHARFRQHLAHFGLPPIADGASAYLKRLRHHGIPRALVSRLLEEFLSEDLAQRNVRGLFEPHIFPALREKYTVFVQLPELFRCEPNEIAVITDTLNDLLEAREANLLTIAYRSGHGHPDVLASARPNLSVSSWMELARRTRFPCQNT